MPIQMKTAQLKNGSRVINLETPFHPDLPARLRALNGKWNADQRVWQMPADLEAEVRQVCLDFFDIDPLAEVPTDLITVRVNVSFLSLRQETLYLFGRAVLRRPGRDNGVMPGEGVSIVSGGFARSGGSRAYPEIGSPDDGTTLLIRDVPRAGLEKVIADYPAAVVEIVQSSAPHNVYLDALLLASKLGPLMKSLDDEQKAEVVKKLLDDGSTTIA